MTATETDPTAQPGTGLLTLQRVAFGGLMAGAGIAALVMAAGLPAVPSSLGEVGPAFLPDAIGIVDIVLAALYLLSVARGKDTARGRISTRSLLLFLIFLAAAYGTRWLGLPLSAGIGAFVGILYQERGKRWFMAATAAIAFWLLTQFGFGWLLGVPLP